MQENNYDLNNNQENNNLPPRQPLGKKQKMAAAFFIVFAIAFMGLWVAQLKKNLREPFTPKNQNADKNGVKNNEQDAKFLDTDKDGLSDSDESNIYKTSPYLEDSDSDGILDKEEIKNGENPNCPKGQVCEDKIMDNASSSVSNIPTNFNLNMGTSSQTNLQGLLGGQADAAILRKSLLEAGMDPNMLNKIDDNTLMQSYQEILNKK